MTYVDRAILNLTQWCCRRFQLLTGRTNVWVAFQLTNLSIVVYFVWAVLFFWGRDRLTRVGVVMFCGAVLYVLTRTIFRESIDSAESSAFRRVMKGYRNPRRVRDMLLRIPFLTLSILFLYPTLLGVRNAAVLRSIGLRAEVVVMSYSLIVLTTVVLYVLACDPLPPSGSKVAEWLRGRQPLVVTPATSGQEQERRRLSA